MGTTHIPRGEIDRTIDAVWRMESARLIAGLARIVRDVGIAEELAQDALVAALEQWPRDGVPQNPGAWLMTAAKRRAIDTLRRSRMLVQKHEEIAREAHHQIPGLRGHASSGENPARGQQFWAPAFCREKKRVRSEAKCDLV